MSNKIPPDVYWYTAKDPHPSKSFSGEIKTKVAVIGGGMAGLSCAQKLHDAGVSVVVIEKDFCGSGASGKTSGFITPDSEIELSSLLDTYGPEKAKRIWEFVLSGVKIIRENIHRYSISCDYQAQDSLFVANNASGFRHVKKEHEARMQLGYASTLYENQAMKEIIGSQKYAGAVRYPETFGMNSYLYCLGLRDALRASGVPIHEQTAAKHIDGHEIFTPGGRITADHIIVATDRFIPDMGALKKEIYHAQTFLGITKPLSPDQIKKMFPESTMMVWDTDLVYNYFRITGDGRLLIGGGDVLYTYARNVVGNTMRFGMRLKNYIHHTFPFIALDLEYVWPGMLGVSKDLLPIMGLDAHNKRIWYVGAATGLPWAAALGFYAAERVLGSRNEFDQDFSPERHFVIGPRMQSLLSTPVTYALSHGIAKYL
ncbi:MAG: FAD dependent oxidoreductase [Parcubacteria group bacterium Gr01-1014_33]|nr:MAG: FAD dependent oxidoreductase [Parcubacteria group bacterium Gr01-1014_33]